MVPVRCEGALRRLRRTGPERSRRRAASTRLRSLVRRRGSAAGSLTEERRLEMLLHPVAVGRARNAPQPSTRPVRDSAPDEWMYRPRRRLPPTVHHNYSSDRRRTVTKNSAVMPFSAARTRRVVEHPLLGAEPRRRMVSVRAVETRTSSVEPSGVLRRVRIGGSWFQPRRRHRSPVEDYAARMARVVRDAADAGLVGVLVTPGPDLVGSPVIARQRSPSGSPCWR